MSFAFSNVPNNNNFPSSSVSSNSVTPGVSASGFIRAASNYAVNRYVPVLLGSVQDRFDSAVENVSKVISGKGNSGNGNKSSSKTPSNVPPSGSGKNGGNGDSKGGRRARSNPNGKLGVGGSPNIPGIPQVSLNSGIDSGTIINPLQNTTEEYSPLFVQCGELIPDLESEKDSSFASLAGKELFYKYLIIVQSEVNYSLARNFTEVSFYNYILKISHALQLYYMIDSILAFTSHSPNNNIAMTRLRMAITPEVANGHIKLKEFLETTPIPPNLLVYIRHMYQNYSFSDVEGSPIIRLSYSSILCTSEYSGSIGLNGSVYSKMLNDLIDCSQCTSIIKKIRSNWLVKLPPSSYEALYDPQFSTFWHNCNIAYEDYGSKDVKYSINTKTNYDPLYYGIFGNRLDGLIYASCSINNENNVMEMGLWKPFSEFDECTSINSSLLHLSNDNLIRPVTDRQMRVSSMVHSAPFTYITKDGNPVWDIIKTSYVGANIPQVHTIENVRQAITRSVGWLLNP